MGKGMGSRCLAQLMRLMGLAREETTEPKGAQRIELASSVRRYDLELQYFPMKRCPAHLQLLCGPADVPLVFAKRSNNSLFLLCLALIRAKWRSACFLI